MDMNVRMKAVLLLSMVYLSVVSGIHRTNLFEEDFTGFDVQNPPSEFNIEGGELGSHCSFPAMGDALLFQSAGNRSVTVGPFDGRYREHTLSFDLFISGNWLAGETPRDKIDFGAFESFWSTVGDQFVGPTTCHDVYADLQSVSRPQWLAETCPGWTGSCEKYVPGTSNVTVPNWVSHNWGMQTTGGSEPYECTSAWNRIPQDVSFDPSNGFESYNATERGYLEAYDSVCTHSANDTEEVFLEYSTVSADGPWTYFTLTEGSFDPAYNKIFRHYELGFPGTTLDAEQIWVRWSQPTHGDASGLWILDNILVHSTIRPARQAGSSTGYTYLSEDFPVTGQYQPTTQDYTSNPKAYRGLVNPPYLFPEDERGWSSGTYGTALAMNTPGFYDVGPEEAWTTHPCHWRSRQYHRVGGSPSTGSATGTVADANLFACLGGASGADNYAIYTTTQAAAAATLYKIGGTGFVSGDATTPMYGCWESDCNPDIDALIYNGTDSATMETEDFDFRFSPPYLTFDWALFTTAGEDLSLQYSLDSGATWITFWQAFSVYDGFMPRSAGRRGAAYHPETAAYITGTPAFTDWDEMSGDFRVYLPNAAHAENVRLRWTVYTDGYLPMPRVGQDSAVIDSVRIESDGDLFVSGLGLALSGRVANAIDAEPVYVTQNGSLAWSSVDDDLESGLTLSAALYFQSGGADWTDIARKYAVDGPLEFELTRTAGGELSFYAETTEGNVTAATDGAVSEDEWVLLQVVVSTSSQTVTFLQYDNGNFTALDSTTENFSAGTLLVSSGNFTVGQESGPWDGDLGYFRVYGGPVSNAVLVNRMGVLTAAAIGDTLLVAFEFEGVGFVADSSSWSTAGVMSSEFSRGGAVDTTDALAATDHQASARAPIGGDFGTPLVVTLGMSDVDTASPCARIIEAPLSGTMTDANGDELISGTTICGLGGSPYFVYEAISDNVELVEDSVAWAPVDENGLGASLVTRIVLTVPEDLGEDDDVGTTDASDGLELSLPLVVGGIAGVFVVAFALGVLLFRGSGEGIEEAEEELPIPEFTLQTAFGSTAVVTSSERKLAKKLVPLERLIVSQDMLLTFALLKSTSITEADEVTKTLVYIYEHHNQTMMLLKSAISREVQNAEGPTTLFRSNSSASKMLKAYSKLRGLEYLFKTLYPIMRTLTTAQTDLEVDPLKMKSSDDENVNKWSLLATTQRVLVAVLRSVPDCPVQFRHICHHLTTCMDARWPGTSAKYSAVGGFIFLRFFCPAITAPESFGLAKEVPETEARRLLVLVAKTLQNLSNGVEFGAKELYMAKMNEFIHTNVGKIRDFFTELSTLPPNAGEHLPPTALPKDVYELALVKNHRHVFKVSSSIDAELAKVPDPMVAGRIRAEVSRFLLDHPAPNTPLPQRAAAEPGSPRSTGRRSQGRKSAGRRPSHSRVAAHNAVRADPTFM